MENRDELISHFSYTQTKKSKQYLNSFFCQKSFDVNQTLYIQRKLKLFLDKYSLISNFKISENQITYIKKFIDEINANQYTVLSRVLHREYFRETANNISLFIDFFYKFGLLLRNFQKGEICLEYQNEIKIIISFINELSINELYQKPLNFQHTKNILHTIEKYVKREKFLPFWDFFYMFDVFCSISKGLRKLDLIFPQFNTENKFCLKDFYHLDVENPVKNSLTITENNVIVLTGANMSGKSTAMKSISSIILLSHLGLPVPADHCDIPFYDSLFLHFSVVDDLKEGYSHFAQEIMNVKNVLIELKTKNCFVVFDEIYNGTNINDASQITIKTIDGLSKHKKSMFILSTHLNGIENMITQNKSIRVLNLECFFEEGEVAFTYRLCEGWSKLEIGNILFAKYGLDELLQLS